MRVSWPGPNKHSQTLTATDGVTWSLTSRVIILTSKLEEAGPGLNTGCQCRQEWNKTNETLMWDLFLVELNLLSRLNSRLGYLESGKSIVLCMAII